MKAENYARALRAMLPRGVQLWAAPVGSVLWSMLLAIGDVYERVGARFEDLQNEHDPRTATEALPEWEHLTHQPGACDEIPATLAQRRIAIIQSLTGIGGASRAYFQAIAQLLGGAVDVEVVEFAPFYVDENRTGDPVGSDELANSIEVVVGAPEVVVPFYVDESPVGEPLFSQGNELLECVLRERFPAHVEVTFIYQAPAP